MTPASRPASLDSMEPRAPSGLATEMPPINHASPSTSYLDRVSFCAMLPRHILCLASLLPVALGCLFAASPNPPARELITCGRDRVHILDLNSRDASGAPKIVWTWKAAGRTDLPATHHALFRSTDECKPVDGGRRILITSSTGGVALVDREKDAVLFYGRAVNAHSADVLPGGRIAVAASRDPRTNNGDALILFDIARSDHEVWRTELKTGHGIIWDEKRQVVWALADQELRTYRLVDWKTATPKLERVATLPLPEGGGHDLYPIPGTSLLSITTETRCWLFDRDQKTLTPHPTLGDQSSIKGISVHPGTRQIAFTQADRPNWWTETIRFLEPSSTLSLSGEQFYKVRWNLPSD